MSGHKWIGASSAASYCERSGRDYRDGYDAPCVKQTSNSELKPCPFCGSDAEHFLSDRHKNFERVECRMCDVEMCAASMGEDDGTKTELVKRWNARAALKGPA